MNKEINVVTADLRRCIAFYSLVSFARMYSLVFTYMSNLSHTMQHVLSLHNPSKV